MKLHGHTNLTNFDISSHNLQVVYEVTDEKEGVDNMGKKEDVHHQAQATVQAFDKPRRNCSTPNNCEEVPSETFFDREDMSEEEKMLFGHEVEGVT
jgi:hypothetical protein